MPKANEAGRDSEPKKVETSEQAADIFTAAYEQSDHAGEQLWVLGLKDQTHVMFVEEIPVDGGQECNPYGSAFFQQAINIGADSIILGHAHADGALEPTEKEKIGTTILCTAAHAIGIPVVDRIAISGLQYRSFGDFGLITSALEYLQTIKSITQATPQTAEEPLFDTLYENGNAECFGEIYKDSHRALLAAEGALSGIHSLIISAQSDSNENLPECMAAASKLQQALRKAQQEFKAKF